MTNIKLISESHEKGYTLRIFECDCVKNQRSLMNISLVHRLRDILAGKAT